MARERRFADLEFRADSPRELRGTAMVYGTEARLPFGRERFEPGAFGDVTGSDVILNVSHDRDRPIARTGAGGLILEDSTAALTMRAALPETREADDALVNVRAGILRGLSIEFEALSDRLEGDLRIVERARLWGVAVVTRPAYGDAKVAARAWEPQRRDNGEGTYLRVWL